jgi:predicted nuclease of predicted toxin-antitoxin system
LKLLIDMNLSVRWVKVLNDAGIDAAHWSGLGPHNAPDSALMDYARVNDQVVLTHDLDFGAILAASQGSKPSVVQVRAQDVSPAVIGPAVIAAAEADGKRIAGRCLADDRSGPHTYAAASSAIALTLARRRTCRCRRRS